MEIKQKNTIGRDESSPLSRRRFVSYAGALGIMAAGIGSIGVLNGCKKSNNNSGSSGTAVNLGSGDTGILNYAYALEQLEAAFYIQVITSPYSNMNSNETSWLTDIRDHEIAHREFFKTVLGSNAIPALQVNFSSIDFGSRDSVLATSKAFEDLGVAAYNGAGQLLTDANNLLLAGKIVSVEARHAALVRDLITANSFAGSDVVDTNGLDRAMAPADVLKVAGTYLKSQLDASHLPS